ncbi:AbrB/MazE/SpoVT family DNA-binding domain-containing protein [Paenibacillus elgii]|uniref:AbrB/MazE/SpoVT family DNA-binding domain-containing protein n=1 Tax=Paenibacillus elgii TaxID=189691 RepID=UPI000248CB60|nr:AbrB/MazE/SpoVT family DNA-binding domain-containing protein [Paenibacillus elgii]
MQEDRKTGIVRMMDNLGRIVIPMEIRRMLNLNPNVKTEYFYDDKRQAIVVYKYRAKECIFCSSEEQNIYFKKFYICMSCIQSLPALQAFIDSIERERVGLTKKKPLKKKIMTPKRKEALDRLQQAIKENPKASQKKLAKILGISQSWVSQLMRSL